MAKCCASSGANCACSIQDGEGTEVRGSGSIADPYRVDVTDGSLTGVVNDCLTTTVAGTGAARTVEATFSPTATVDCFPDVNTGGTQAVGDVLTWDGGQWVASPAGAAAPGTVNSDQTLDGDGSVGAPLSVAHDPDRWTDTSATGIGVSEDGQNQMVLHYPNAAARTASAITPELNSLSALNTEPGVLWYWDGAAWQRITSPAPIVENTLAAWSGAYVAGMPLRQVTKVITGTGSTATAFATGDYPDAAGVASAWFQVMGNSAKTVVIDTATGPLPGDPVNVFIYNADGTLNTGTFEFTANAWMF